MRSTPSRQPHQEVGQPPRLPLDKKAAGGKQAVSFEPSAWDASLFISIGGLGVACPGGHGAASQFPRARHSDFGRRAMAARHRSLPPRDGAGRIDAVPARQRRSRCAARGADIPLWLRHNP